MFLCPHCGKLKESKSKLNQHIRDCHGERQKCDICEQTFSSKAYLSRHVQIVHLPVPTQCKKCLRMFPSRPQFMDHKSNCGLVKFQCSVCDEIFDSEAATSRHLSHQHGNEFKCLKCRVVFEDREILDSHIREAHPDSLFQCDHCGKEFVYYWMIKQHMPCTEGVEPQAPMPDDLKWWEESMAATEESLQAMSIAIEQEREMVADANAAVQCDTCKKTFISFTIFEAHLMVAQDCAADYYDSRFNFPL